VRVPVCRTSVLDASAVLTQLAHELVAPAPVGVSGVAQLRVLVSDGLGPLYCPGRSADLQRVAERALEALRRV
jgi:hypothetical protein